MTTPATLRLLSAFHYESARANLGYARVLRRFGAEAAAASAILRARESRRLARAARSHPDTESYRYAVVARVVPQRITHIEVTTPYSGGATIEVGTPASGGATIEVGTPAVAGLSAVVVTVGGAPGAGVCQVLVFYVVPAGGPSS